MKKVIRKFFIDFEKEEKWINEMAAKGLNLISFSDSKLLFFLRKYTFEEGKPGEYIYRSEFLDEVASSDKSNDYIKFLEEAGTECICTHKRWIYLRKKASEGPFNIYSDFESRIKHYKKVSNRIGLIGAYFMMVEIWKMFSGAEYRRDLSSMYIFLSSIRYLLFFMCLIVFISYIKRINKLKKERQLYE